MNGSPGLSLLAMLTGCESCFEPPAQMDPALVKLLEGGWVEGIILDPEAFRNLAQGPESRLESTISLGSNHSRQRAGGVGRQRARAQQALVDGDIERLAKRSFKLATMHGVNRS